MEGRTHVPVVDEALCGVCGICRGACPALASPDLLEGESTTMRAVLAPQATKIGQDLAPCREACPLGQDISGYLAFLAEGDQSGALEVILRDNPLPSVLGRVCHHPCQQACFSSPVQTPPSIRDLKRFAAQAPRPVPELPQGASLAKVAVVGAGPAGLAAAWELARQGAKAVVYDAQPMAGGMLAWAIPDFRLPRQDLQRDLDYVAAHGVEFKLGQALTPEGVTALRRECDAVILACGAPQAQKAGLPGEDLDGVWQGLDFLRETALGNPPQLTAPVVVVGGGNVALDAARVALRRGVAVTLVYRRDREQMPAYAEELEAAEAEGIKFIFRAQPVALEAGEGGGVAVLSVQGTTPGQQAADGRVSFFPDPNDQRSLEAGSVILALGQRSEAEAWASGLGLDTLQGDAQGCLAPRLYLAGDLQTGPATVVEAMAGGIKAARAIMEEVRS